MILSHLALYAWRQSRFTVPPDNAFPPFPGPQPPSQSPPATAAPPIPASFLPLTPIQPDTPVVPTLVVPPTIPDEQMTSVEKRPLGSPVSDRPSTKARPTRPVQMPASSSPPSVPPSNHLGGNDRLVFSPPVVQTPKPKKRKPEDEPPKDEEDAGDPDAQPSGHNLPIADDDEQPVSQPVSPESPEAAIVDDDAPGDVAVMWKKKTKKMTQHQMRPSITMICSWARAVGVGCQQNRSSAAILVRSQYLDTLMAHLLILSLFRSTLTS